MAENKDLSTIRGPFRVYEKPKKKEPISTVDEYQESFLKSLEAYELKQRKPVRWNFYTDNEGMFQIGRALDPMMKTNERLYRIITKKTCSLEFPNGQRRNVSTHSSHFSTNEIGRRYSQTYNGSSRSHRSHS